MLSVNSNPLATQVAHNFNRIYEELNTTSNRISTGKRINSAKDDAAGIAIVSKIKATLGSYSVVQRNIQQGSSLLEVSDSSLKGVQDTLKTMRDLAVQASNETLTTSDRVALNKTFLELRSQIDSIVGEAELFGQNLIKSGAADVKIQSGLNNGSTTSLTAVSSDTTTLGVNSSQVDTSSNAGSAIDAIDSAISKVSANQSVIGAQMSGLSIRERTVEDMMVNLDEARSRIEDISLENETAKLQQLQTQQQLAIGMLSMVSSYPNFALSLLR
jgi:flagellin